MGVGGWRAVCCMCVCVRGYGPRAVARSAVVWVVGYWSAVGGRACRLSRPPPSPLSPAPGDSSCQSRRALISIQRRLTHTQRQSHRNALWWLWLARISIMVVMVGTYFDYGGYGWHAFRLRWLLRGAHLDYGGYGWHAFRLWWLWVARILIMVVIAGHAFRLWWLWWARMSIMVSNFSMRFSNFGNARLTPA